MSKLREKSVFLLPLLIVLIVGINLFLTWTSIEDNVVDNFVVDLAGRQRMFSQKILNEFIVEKLGGKTNLQNTINLFLEHSLTLENGGEIKNWALNHTENVVMPPAPTPEIAKLLSEQRRVLSEFTKAGYNLPNLNKSSKNPQVDLRPLIVLADKLNSYSNDVVLEYDRYYRNSLEGSIRIRAILSVFIILMGFSLIYILYRKDVITRQLEAAKKTALDAVQTKSNFFASISHEIRNPLNVIVGIPNILESTPLSTEQRKFVDMLKYTSRHLLTLINDILDFSKIESGNTRLNLEPFDLKKFTEGLIEFNSFKAREKNIILRLNWDSLLNSNVKGDPHRLRQVLDNLVGNAIKFTDKGHVGLTIKKINVANLVDQSISFCVSDTGIGISESDQYKIFDAYVQVGQDSIKKRGGSGLGLAISKQLIDLMGGALSVKSRPGVGTEISFIISIQSNPQDLNERAAITSTPDLNTPSVSKLSILIVDDSIDNLIILRTLLERTGRFIISSAENGQSALNLFKAQKFDLVLMDMQMPVLDGTQAAKAMRMWIKRESMTPIPIVALTANSLDSVPLGFDDYTLKPIDLTQLLAVISRCLRASPTVKNLLSPNSPTSSNQKDITTH